MKFRIQVAIALAVLSFPLLGLGLLDPLEGLPALILGLVALIVARMLSNLKVPKLAWIPLLITISLLAVALLVVSLELQAAQSLAFSTNRMSTKVGNALAGPAGWLLWASRISLITMLAGIGLYVRNLLRALRETSKTEGN
jgi:hypothetical protein